MTCPGRVGGKPSRKESFEQLVKNFSEHLHMSARPVEKARDSVFFTHKNQPSLVCTDKKSGKIFLLLKEFTEEIDSK
jgi:hypothetical protein